MAEIRRTVCSGFVKTFQLSVDSDSCMVGPSGDGKRNRIVISNLDVGQLERLAMAIRDAKMENDFLYAAMKVWK